MACRGGSEDCVDHGHIEDGVCDGHWYRAAFEDGVRKTVALNGVLIADRELFVADASAEDVDATVNGDAAGPVRWRIEGNFDFDAACERLLLAFAGSWRRQFRDVVVWFNGNTILSAQPAAQVDRLAARAAKREKRQVGEAAPFHLRFTDRASHA